MALKNTLTGWAKRAKIELRTLTAIATHPGTPRHVKILAAGLAAYALSPLDLIPDFIPVLGYLDDALLLPLGIYILYRLTPAGVIEECRAAAGRST